MRGRKSNGQGHRRDTPHNAETQIPRRGIRSRSSPHKRPSTESGQAEAKTSTPPAVDRVCAPPYDRSGHPLLAIAAPHLPPAGRGQRPLTPKLPAAAEPALHRHPPPSHALAAAGDARVCSGPLLHVMAAATSAAGTALASATSRSAAWKSAKPTLLRPCRAKAKPGPGRGATQELEEPPLGQQAHRGRGGWGGEVGRGENTRGKTTCNTHHMQWLLPAPPA